MSGLLFAGVVGLVMPLPTADTLTLAVVGMSACLGAVVRAPVTGILIVFEMTHEFSLVPALMIGALISQAISRRMTRANFYDAILEQDGHKLEKLLPPRDFQSWQKLPVSTIAEFPAGRSEQSGTGGSGENFESPRLRLFSRDAGGQTGRHRHARPNWPRPSPKSARPNWRPSSAANRARPSGNCRPRSSNRRPAWP